MPWYRCYVRGENFLKAVAETGRVERCGFYTTRWLEAGSPEEAETKALALMRSEDTFAPPLGQTPPKDAKVYFEQIIEVDGPRRQGGASRFLMEKNGDG